MNEKLTLQDLVDFLSKKSDITKKEADLFLRELFQLILDRIFENDSVKIKDFGTFKLISVSSRESVNVNTGEKIQIPAHQRLSFAPDRVLKELVNKPFSQFESVSLDEKSELESVIEEKAEIEPEVEEFDIELDEIGVDEIDVIEEQNNNEDVDNELPIINEEVSEKEKPNKKVSNYSPSFSYTYTYTSKDKEEDDTVVLTVSKPNGFVQPKVQFTDGDASSSRSDNVPFGTDEYIVGGTVVDVPISETVHSKSVVPNESAESDIEEHIDADLAEDSTTFVSAEFDSEIETEDDALAPLLTDDESPATEVYNGNTSNKSSALERPLIPVGDEIENDDSVIVQKGDTPTNDHGGSIIYTKPVENRGLVYTESLEAVESSSVYSYANPSFGTRLKKRLPIIFFVLVIIAFTVYSFLNLFDVRYDFEDQLNRTNFRLEDSLVYLTEIDAASENHLNDIDVQVDSLVSASHSTSGVVSSTENSEVNSETVKADSLRSGFKGAGKSEKIFSERLHIGIVNKAMHHLHKYMLSDSSSLKSADLSSGLSARDNKSNNIANQGSLEGGQYVTLAQGSTLRTLSTKYYGNSVYWVYIYRANKAKLSNPNDIAVGMKIFIPELSDYGVDDPKSSRDIQIAKALETSY